MRVNPQGHGRIGPALRLGPVTRRVEFCAHTGFPAQHPDPKRLAQLRSIERSYTVCVVAVMASAVIETTQISGAVPENISRVPARSEQARSCELCDRRSACGHPILSYGAVSDQHGRAIQTDMLFKRS